MWNRKTVKVNCKKNYDNDKRLTLVDNRYGEAHDFNASTDVLKYLLDEGFTGVSNYIDELVAEKFNKEQEERKWRRYGFYVKKSSAPYITNSIDSSKHVKNWEVSGEDMFTEDGLVLIEYVADKQVLIQCADGVVIDL